MESAKYVASIKDYLMAGNPCLFLPTIEEEVAERRVKEAILQLISDNNRESADLAVWKITSGMRIFPFGTYSLDPSTKIAGDTGPKELVTALQTVEKSTRSMIAIFYHIRHYLGSPQVIQQIIDTVNKARYSYSTIIFVGPYLELPPELHDIVTFCECPLPTRHELETEFTKLADGYKEELGLNLDLAETKQLIQKASIAASGLTTLAAENAASLSIAVTSTFDYELIQQQKEQDIKKSDILEFIQTKETIDTVGGFDELKSWISKRKKGFTDEAKTYGLNWPKGVLIAGIAGTGKSLISKAIATYFNLPLLRLDMGKVYSSLVGSSEARLRQALKVAEAVSPCVLQVEELEKSLAGSQGTSHLDSGVTSRVVATLLTWRQETTAPVFMVATVNDPRMLPPMVYRKGRFDEIWSVELPNEGERKAIFEIHLKKRKRDPQNFDTALLALKSNKFTGAEIESCIEDAMFSAFYEDEEVETRHILESIQNTSPQNIVSNDDAELLAKWMETYARPVSSQQKEIVSNIRQLQKRGKK